MKQDIEGVFLINVVGWVRWLVKGWTWMEPPFILEVYSIQRIKKPGMSRVN